MKLLLCQVATTPFNDPDKLSIFNPAAKSQKEHAVARFSESHQEATGLEIKVKELDAERSYLEADDIASLVRTVDMETTAHCNSVVTMTLTTGFQIIVGVDHPCLGELPEDAENAVLDEVLERGVERCLERLEDHVNFMLAWAQNGIGDPKGLEADEPTDEPTDEELEAIKNVGDVEEAIKYVEDAVNHAEDGFERALGLLLDLISPAAD